MPQVSSRRLHSREYIARVLRAAGQFAHVESAEIDRLLSDLYNPERRWGAEADDVIAGMYAEAVPDWAVKAVRSKAHGPLYDAAKLIDLMNYKFGVLCPLCQSIERHDLRHTLPRVALFFCPTFLFAYPTHYGASFHCQCAACDRTLSRLIGAEFAGGWLPSLMCAESLSQIAWGMACLMSNRPFRDRVRAGSQVRLRFDPRARGASPAAAPIIERSITPPSLADLVVDVDLKAGRTEIRDSKVRNLVLRISKSGAQSWSYQYRLKGRLSTQRMTIGPHPAISIELARERALRIAAVVSAGDDPKAQSRAALFARRNHP